MEHQRRRWGGDARAHAPVGRERATTGPVRRRLDSLNGGFIDYYFGGSLFFPPASFSFSPRRFRLTLARWPDEVSVRGVILGDAVGRTGGRLGLAGLAAAQGRASLPVVPLSPLAGNVVFWQARREGCIAPSVGLRRGAMIRLKGGPTAGWLSGPDLAVPRAGTAVGTGLLRLREGGGGGSLPNGAGIRTVCGAGKGGCCVWCRGGGFCLG